LLCSFILLCLPQLTGDTFLDAATRRDIASIVPETAGDGASLYSQKTYVVGGSAGKGRQATKSRLNDGASYQTENRLDDALAENGAAESRLPPW
jgi:hypothetical protein